jgi:hypothetical protein
MIKAPVSFWKEFTVNQKVLEVERLTFLSADTLSFYAMQASLTVRNSSVFKGSCGNSQRFF